MSIHQASFNYPRTPRCKAAETEKMTTAPNDVTCIYCLRMRADRAEAELAQLRAELDRQRSSWVSETMEATVIEAEQLRRQVEIAREGLNNIVGHSTPRQQNEDPGSACIHPGNIHYLAKDTIKRMDEVKP